MSCSTEAPNTVSAGNMVRILHNPSAQAAHAVQTPEKRAVLKSIQSMMSSAFRAATTESIAVVLVAKALRALGVCAMSSITEGQKLRVL